MAWVTPIYNRTAGTYYSAADLNRIEGDVQYLTDLLATYGYTVIVTTKTDWVQTDIPTETDMERMLGNVQNLVDVYQTMPDTPALPITMTRITYTDANTIERAFEDVKILIQYMIAAFRYSGDVYAGEGYCS